MIPPVQPVAGVHRLRTAPQVPAVLRHDESNLTQGEEVSEPFHRRIVGIEEGTPLANVSVLELAVLLTYQRFSYSGPEIISAEIAKWTRAPVNADDVRGPIRRLLHVGHLEEEADGIDVTADARRMVTTTLRQMMRLTLRDRYIFDLVEIIDLSHESWGFNHDQPR